MRLQFVLISEDFQHAANQRCGSANPAGPAALISALLVGSCCFLVTSAYPPVSIPLTIVVAGAVAAVVWAAGTKQPAWSGASAFSPESLWQTVVLSESGGERQLATGQQRWPWASLRRILVFPSHTIIHCDQEHSILIPARAIPDRVALVAMLRQHAKVQPEVFGCVRCGYDVSQTAFSRCPECGAGFDAAA